MPEKLVWLPAVYLCHNCLSVFTIYLAILTVFMVTYLILRMSWKFFYSSVRFVGMSEYSVWLSRLSVWCLDYLSWFLYQLFECFQTICWLPRMSFWLHSEAVDLEPEFRVEKWPRLRLRFNKNDFSKRLRNFTNTKNFFFNFPGWFLIYFSVIIFFFLILTFCVLLFLRFMFVCL